MINLCTEQLDPIFVCVLKTCISTIYCFYLFNSEEFTQNYPIISINYSLLYEIWPKQLWYHYINGHHVETSKTPTKPNSHFVRSDINEHFSASLLNWSNLQNIFP